MADLQEAGLKLVAEGAEAFESTIGGVGDVLSTFGNIAVEAASMAVEALGSFFADSFSGALEAETTMARFDAQLQAVASSAEEQAAAYASASEQNITFTRLTAEEVDDLQDSYSVAAEKLGNMETAMAENEEPTAAQTVALKEQREKVEELASQIAGGLVPITTTLADQMGLIPPVAHLTRQELLDLADEYKNLAGGSDDAVIAAESVLLKFTTIGKETFPDALKSSADLAALMGTDLSSAAQTLGFALDNPGEALTRLNKTTGAFTDAEIEQIKAMAAAGDSAGAQALILSNLEDAIGGTAEALANTTAGQWAIFQETIADAGETIVGAFLPALMGIAGPILENVVPAISEFATSVGNIITLITTGDFSGGIFGWMEDDERIDALFEIRDALMEFVDQAVVWFTTDLPAAMAAGQAAIQPVIDAAMNLANAFGESMPMIQGTVQVMADFVIGQFNTLSPTLIANVSSTLDSIATFWREHGDEIMAIVTIAFEVIATTIGTTLTLVSGIIASALALINGDTVAATDILQNTFTVIMDNILSLVGTDLDTFVADWSGTFSMVDDVVNIGIAAVGNAILAGLQVAIDSSRAFLVDFLQFGADVVAGIVDGIHANIADIGNALLGGLQDAIDAAQALLGIHSPSKVAMKLIGTPFSEGIAEGILAGLGKVDAAVALTGASMVSPPMSAGAIGAQYAYSNTDARQFNLNVSTPKPMTNVMGEFAVMQTLYGGAI